MWFSSLHAHLGALCCDKSAHVWSYPALQAEMLDTSVSSSHTNEEEKETPGRKGCSWSREKGTGCVLCGPSCTLGLGPGGCELERPGQRGVERIPGHTEGRWPAELGTRCWSGWQPASPGPLFVGREAAFREAGCSAPAESWRSCMWTWSRNADVNGSGPVCRRRV